MQMTKTASHRNVKEPNKHLRSSCLWDEKNKTLPMKYVPNKVNSSGEKFIKFTSPYLYYQL